MALYDCIGGRKSTAVVAYLVVAIFAISTFPTKAGGVEAQIETTTGNGCGDGEDCGEILMLEDFAGPRHKWVEMNDPVMGGKSTGTFRVDESNHVGVFHGSVEIVPFLRAPGFVKAETARGESWPDASSCKGLQLALRSSTPSYEGFRVSFGSKRPPHSFPFTYGFKANLELDATQPGFQTIRLPFESFTDKWDAGTGDAVVACAENKEYCPDASDKANLYSIAVWGEGVEGEVDLQIQSIAAYGCNDGNAASDDIEDETELEAQVSIPSTGDKISLEYFAKKKRYLRTSKAD